MPVADLQWGGGGGGFRWVRSNPHCLKFTLKSREMASLTFQILKFPGGACRTPLVTSLALTNSNHPSQNPGSTPACYIIILVETFIRYLLLVYITTQVNSAFRAIWLVPQSQDIKWYSPPGGFERKKMACKTQLVLYILKQLFASVSVNSGGYLPRRSGSVNTYCYSPPLRWIIEWLRATTT